MAEHPFTEQDLERIKASLAELEQAERLSELAQRAGLDVSVQAERVREAKAQLLRIRQVFFPGR